ncbi:MAG: PilT/PilU family type 4a pilus ATPase [Rickettsiales bacterium]|jgi:twitching motility protein PilT|nr:PilT/PilU family type 4a pilus ATPase [Rickettsiales bacterium]
MTATLEEGNFLNGVLLKLEKLKVSDIHLKSGYKIYYRSLGDVKVMEDSVVLDDSAILGFLKPVINEKAKEDFRRDKQADFGFFTSNNTRYRANLYKTSTGLSLCLRHIESKVRSFADLMVPPILVKIAELQKGLVIISGPTGSGKSTTLSSMIDYINENQEKHIITVEDPIEFVHRNKKSLINQREIGVDATSFGAAVVSALREDPDIILIGEIRDSHTIKECLRAAETGHLVFTTMHTQSAAKSIDRIVDTCEAGEKEMVRAMLSTSLQAVVLQKLLKRKDGSGRVCAFEVLVGTGAVRNLIKENKISQIDSMIQTGSKFGMVDMVTSVTTLFHKGIISKEEFELNTVDMGKE